MRRVCVAGGVVSVCPPVRPLWFRCAEVRPFLFLEINNAPEYAAKENGRADVLYGRTWKQQKKNVVGATV